MSALECRLLFLFIAPRCFIIPLDTTGSRQSGLVGPVCVSQPVLIRLNRFFYLGKNRNRSNRFCAIYCDLLRFFAIYCDFFLGNQIRRHEKTEEDCKDLVPSMVSLLGPF